MIKDIVVHLTGSEEDVVRLRFAATVAEAFDAHITGLQIHALPEVIAITDPTGSALLRSMLEESNRQAAAVSAKLSDEIGKLGTSTELRRLDVYPAQIGHQLAAETRTADLFIGTQPYGDPAKQQRIEEAVLLQSGRGCIFVPPKQKPVEKLETILVAWKNTREAARAVAEAIPFLQRAKLVVVAIVEEDGAGLQYGSEPGADIGRYLSRHDVKSEVRMINGWSDTGKALLNLADTVGADLIVMGGYGHSRFRELVLGGVTRHMLTGARVPVLMAH